MSVVLTIIIVLALIGLGAIIATWIFSKVFGRGPVMADLPAEEEEQIKEANRIFALNGELSQIGFDTVKDGYRRDQVDDLVATLTEEVARLKGDREASESKASTQNSSESKEIELT